MVNDHLVDCFRHRESRGSAAEERRQPLSSTGASPSPWVSALPYGNVEIGSTQAKFLRHIGQHAPISQAGLARATGTDPPSPGGRCRAWSSAA